MDRSARGVVADLLGSPVVSDRALAGGDITRTTLATTADGRRVVVKSLPGASDDFFAAEARGLSWLRVSDGVPVPSVLGVSPEALVLEYVPPGPPSQAVAREFGARLARTHGAGASGFGGTADGFIGSLPMSNRAWPTWAEFFAAERIEPYARAARATGSLTEGDARVIASVAARLGELVPSEPVARLHGDLWSGNVLWGADGAGVHLIDPAAYGGHRESDLAMLHLFGAPHLADITCAYAEAAPLAPAWRERLPIQQLFPLLVHAVLFGGSYGRRAAAGVAGFV